MPATIEKTAKKAPAKKAATKKAPAKAQAKPKTEKFVAPAKPTTEPTSLERSDYGYTLPNGQFRFWQGYDAKFKKRLMEASRVLPQTDTAKKARRILVEAGWSTDEREDAMVALAQQKVDRAVARTKAKAEKAKAKAAKVQKDEQDDTTDVAA